MLSEKNKYILAIETSCDDTSIALMDNSTRELVWHESFSQEKIMAKWGGVVPEIAARNHSEKILTLLDLTFKKFNLCKDSLKAIAVTALPGLLGPLLTGVNIAKTLSLIYQTPVIPVNHLFAHLEAIHLSPQAKISYPYLGLLVSGGHSSFFIVRSSTDFELLGGTIDDAAGEAFDKGGKILGLEYPAGKEIDTLAKLGDKTKYQFPIGLKSKKSCQLSYSGTKTALKIFLQKNPETIKEQQGLYDVAASYQEAIVQALKLKLKYAIEQARLKEKSLPIVVGGGVACNSRLRTVLSQSFRNVSFVAPEFCTDNAAMIANYGQLNIQAAISFPESLNIDAQSRFINKTIQK